MGAGLMAAGPALADSNDTQLCSPDANGGTMADGVCVLPALNVGQNAEEFLLNSGGTLDGWTIVAGSISPGMQMLSSYAAGSTIIGGTPTQQGTFTFTVDNAFYPNPPSQGTYSITVNPPLPLTIVLPASGSTLFAGTIGVPYTQAFFLSGGEEPSPGRWPPGSSRLALG
jgi:hypothetical protein